MWCIEAFWMGVGVMFLIALVIWTLDLKRG